MAQTTAAMNGNDAVVEVSSDNSTWVDISGSLESMIPDAETVGTGMRKTVDGIKPIVMVGRGEPMNIPLAGIFTETAGEMFKTLETIWLTTGKTIYLRYFPEGKASGNTVYTTGISYLTSFQYPPIDANSNDPLPFTANVFSPGFTSRVYTTA